MTPEEIQALKDSAEAAKANLASAVQKVKSDAAASAERIRALEKELADSGGNAAAVAELKAIAEELVKNANETANSLNPPAEPSSSRSRR